MVSGLRIEVIRGSDLGHSLRSEVCSLCTRAYDEDFSGLFGSFTGPVHVLGWVGSALASHAMWVTRWLEMADVLRLRTAYVEMVATDPRYQGCGYASAVMRHLACAITDYDLGALCPADTQLYARLGWTFWRGPLSIRTEHGLITTPAERIMVLRLPRTPPLDPDQPLSAEWRPGELW